MRICVCGSMSLAREMVTVAAALERHGHFVVLPDQSEAVDVAPDIEAPVISSSLIANRKIEHDYIRKHYEAIARAEAVLVLNYKRFDLVGYVGGNSFLEMGFAHVLRKPIYLVEPLNESQTAYYPEMLAMQPVNIGGDWTKLMGVGRQWAAPTISMRQRPRSTAGPSSRASELTSAWEWHRRYRPSDGRRHVRSRGGTAARARTDGCGPCRRPFACCTNRDQGSPLCPTTCTCSQPRS